MYKYPTDVRVTAVLCLMLVATGCVVAGYGIVLCIVSWPWAIPLILGFVAIFTVLYIISPKILNWLDK